MERTVTKFEKFDVEVSYEEFREKSNANYINFSGRYFNDFTQETEYCFNIYNSMFDDEPIKKIKYSSYEIAKLFAPELLEKGELSITYIDFDDGLPFRNMYLEFSVELK